jgi:hypothetical protein
VGVTVSSSVINSFLLCVKNAGASSFSQNFILVYARRHLSFSEGPSFTAITKYGSCQNFINKGSDVQPTANQPKPHHYLLVVQPVSTNNALGTESRQYDRSVWIGGNVNQPEMKYPEGASGHPTTGLTTSQPVTDL